MRVRVQYCRPCGYRRYAEELANRLREDGVEAIELVPGNFGVFKTWVDDRLVFDKYQEGGLLGRFGFGPVPSTDHLLQRIRQAQG